MHILSPETDICLLESAEVGRKTVKNISWQISTKVCPRTRAWTSHPLIRSQDSLLNKQIGQWWWYSSILKKVWRYWINLFCQWFILWLWLHNSEDGNVRLFCFSETVFGSEYRYGLRSDDCVYRIQAAGAYLSHYNNWTMSIESEASDVKNSYHWQSISGQVSLNNALHI